MKPANRIKRGRLKIELQNPCGQNWDDLTPVEGGRHCKRCDKCVVDFTSFTDKALFDYFKTAKTQPCGMYRPDQLNRTIAPYAQPSWHSKAAAALTGLAVSLGFAGESKAAP